MGRYYGRKWRRWERERVVFQSYIQIVRDGSEDRIWGKGSQWVSVMRRVGLECHSVRSKVETWSIIKTRRVGEIFRSG